VSEWSDAALEDASFENVLNGRAVEDLGLASASEVHVGEQLVEMARGVIRGKVESVCDHGHDDR